MYSSKKRKYSKKIISIFLSFVICLSLFLMILILIMRSTIFNEAFIKQSISKSSYAAYLTNDIKNNFRNFGHLSGGVPDEIFKNSINEKNVYNDISNYFSFSMQNKKFSVSTTDLSSRLKTQITAYAATQDTSLVSKADLSKNIYTLVKSCTDVYTRSIQIEFVPQFGAVSAKFAHYFNLFFSVLLIVIVFLFLFISFLNRKLLFIIRYSIYSISAVLIMLLTVPTYIKIAQIIPRIGISSKPLYLLITTILTATFNTFYFYSCVFAGLLLILVIGYIIVSRVKKIDSSH
jgi:hypothetical protein